MTKYIIGLALILTSFCFGAYYGKGQKEITTVEKIVEKEGATKVIYRDHIVTVTKVVQPDGTVTETTTTKDSDKITEKKKTETGTSKDTTITPVLARYSLGLGAKLSPLGGAEIRSLRPDYVITAGYRIAGPIFLELGGSTDKQVTLGLRVEL